jgi:arsenate reductase
MKKVLFLCTGNSCRSQMAEGWCRFYYPGRIEAYSAGLRAQGLNPLAAQVMKEVGVDISAQTSDALEAYLNVTFDLVVTVCDHADAHCPAFPGAIERIHQCFDDPPKLAEQALTQDEVLACYRRVRDQIGHWMQGLDQHVNA